MNELKIGWASRDVSTDKPVSIPGQFHVRVSKGVFDPVSVTALVIDNDTDLVVFLSADIVVIRDHMLDIIRDKVAQRHPRFPVEKIIMNATHTHTGPGIYSDRPPAGETGSVTPGLHDLPHEQIEIASSDAYREFFSDQAADAVAEAYTRRAAGGIAYGYRYAVVTHSRRVVYFDDQSKRPGAVNNSTHGVNGHARMYGETNDAMFSHYEAGADPFINLLYTFDPDGRLTGAIINVPCPAQNKDIHTALPMKHAVETVWLDKRRITPEEADHEKEQLAELMRREFIKDGTPLERLVHDSQLLAGRKRCRRVLQRYETQDREPKLPMELHAVSIGDIAFTTNRFELYMDFMHRIQARSPFVQTFVIQLAGIPGPDGGTYLATGRGVEGRGYSASRYCNIVSPQGGQELVEESLRLLNTIAPSRT